MTSAHTRKKQPDLVRRTLLDCAAKLAVEHGTAAVTIQAVAAAAGVTKGGLFHHFPNKRALIEAVILDLLEQFSAEIDARMAEDAVPYGRFTRAYVDVTFGTEGFGINSPMAAMALSMMADPLMARSWSEWLTERLGRHKHTDSAPMLDIVRLAADGAWTAHITGVGGPPFTAPDELRLRLLALTQTP